MLSIIIVSFNTSDLLKNCLMSVYKVLKSDKLEDKSEIILIDNNSSDDSISIVKNFFPKVKLILNKENLGFSKANNQGIRYAKGDFILLLNSDTKVNPGTFRNLIDSFYLKESIAVVGPKIINPDGSIQPSAGYIPSFIKVFLWMTFLDDLPFLNQFIKPYHVESPDFYKESRLVDWVSGACLMVLKKVLDKSGLMDENIFMYGEEVEWCFRIRKNGFRIYLDCGTDIIHYKGGSGSGKLSGIKEEFKFIKYFYKKHKPGWQLALVIYFLRFGALLRIFLFGIIGRDKRKFSIYAEALKVA